jgi:glutathione S-transferase
MSAASYLRDEVDPILLPIVEDLLKHRPTGEGIQQAIAAQTFRPCPSYDLHYFDARGAAEISRYMFAISGTPFEDTRVDIKEWKATIKSSGQYARNGNVLPVLILDGKTWISQSRTIERFLAQQFGLMGRNPLEAALIDAACEHIRDLKDMERNLRRNPAMSDDEKAVARDKQFSDDLPAKTKLVEGTLPAFHRSGPLSYADITVYWTFSQLWGDRSGEALAMLDGCPTLKAMHDKVKADDRVRQYEARRPVPSVGHQR